LGGGGTLGGTRNIPGNLWREKRWKLDLGKREKGAEVPEKERRTRGGTSKTRRRGGGDAVKGRKPQQIRRNWERIRGVRKGKPPRKQQNKWERVLTQPAVPY